MAEAREKRETNQYCRIYVVSGTAKTLTYDVQVCAQWSSAEGTPERLSERT